MGTYNIKVEDASGTRHRIKSLGTIPEIEGQLEPLHAKKKTTTLLDFDSHMHFNAFLRALRKLGYDNIL